MRCCAIDIHHHCVPPGLLEEVKRHGNALGAEVEKTKEGRTTLSIAGERFFVPPDLSGLEPRVSMMDKAKVAIAALEPQTSYLGYSLDAERGEAWCKLYNQCLHDLVRQYPDRFVALAAVPMQDPVRAAKVLEHAIGDLKLSGGYIASNVNGRYYDSTEFDPIESVNRWYFVKYRSNRYFIP